MGELITDGVCVYGTSGQLDPLSRPFIIACLATCLGVFSFWFMGFINQPFAAFTSESRPVRLIAVGTTVAVSVSILIIFAGMISDSFLNWLQTNRRACVESPELFTTALTLTMSCAILAAFWLHKRLPSRDLVHEKQSESIRDARRISEPLIPALTLTLGFWLSALTSNLEILVWVPVAVSVLTYTASRKSGRKS